MAGWPGARRWREPGAVVDEPQAAAAPGQLFVFNRVETFKELNKGQLLAQTAVVTERKHFYKTEVHLLQDLWLSETEAPNAALVASAAAAIAQTTAARAGMLTKDQWDKK